jgi:hypothetical protein
MSEWRGIDSALQHWQVASHSRPQGSVRACTRSGRPSPSITLPELSNVTRKPAEGEAWAVAAAQNAYPHACSASVTAEGWAPGERTFHHFGLHGQGRGSLGRGPNGP